MNKTTLVIGASNKPERYAYKAIVRLREKGHKVYGLALKPGSVNDVDFMTEQTPLNDIDTVTLYVGPQHQEGYREYIMSLKPKRVLFNPGTENPSLQKTLQDKGINVMEACTLVLLSTGQY